MKAAYCGSFDPLTLGHLDIIRRASTLFDSLTVYIAHNSSKSGRFDLETRRMFLEEACRDLKNVSVAVLNGLVSDTCQKEGIQVLVRGVRSPADFEYEQNMAYMNHELAPEVETAVFFSRPEYMFCSSSNVWELIRYGRDISGFVPEVVARTVQQMRREDNALTD